jgi:hypothetical protein
MAKVFAHDDCVTESGLLTRRVPRPRQPLSLSTALMPGKGVRRIRCIGRSHETLPGPDDGASLCARRRERLAGADPGNGPMTFWTSRWLRRRPQTPVDS